MRTPDFWQHKGPLALLLSPLGLLYGLSVAWKARTAKPYHCGVPVICVGNLTAGGSGKTPVALAVATRLLARGAKVFFLTRGYGGAEAGPLLVTNQSAAKVGDEALLLAKTAPTIVARDRAAGAKLAVAQGATVIVMDDGHQNFTLAKALSLAVVDGFGNGLMIPAGPLRESVAQGLSRADVVIAMNDVPLAFGGPVLRARLAADSADFKGKRVFAFAGIGRPEKFITSLQEAGAIVTGWEFFPDHHPYSTVEIARLRQQAGDAALVTTEKDFVRLEAADRHGIAVLPVAVTFDQPQLLDSILATV
jgi:tetraacyldisaccharide 4'-kinase